MSGCTSPWFGGLTVDHLYADCPARMKAEGTLRRYRWWTLGGDHIDPHDTDICGLCRHRHNRKEHPMTAHIPLQVAVGDEAMEAAGDG